MANAIRTGDPRGFNKGHCSKFCESSQVRQTPEEGWRTYRPKRCGNNNKDEDNSPKTLNDKNHQASSQKFRQQLNDHTVQGTYQVLPLWARVDLGAMAMKGYSTFPKHYWSLTIKLFSVISRTLFGWWGSLTPLQRCNQCILQPPLTGLSEFYVI